MLRDITIGRYIEADSPLHRADARSKIITAIIYSAAVFALNSPFSLATLTVITAAAVVISKTGVLTVIKGLRPLRWFILFTVAITIFTTPGNTLWQWSIFHITDTGLISAARLAIKLILLVAGTSLMTLTTPPIELTDGFARLLKPLKLIKVPVDDIAMMISITLRFIPMLADEAEKIIKAQKARGASFDAGGLKKVRAVIPLTVPLFISVLRRSEELALAMDSRCYGKGCRRPRKKTRFHNIDVLLLVATSTICVFLGIFEIIS